MVRPANLDIYRLELSGIGEEMDVGHVPFHFISGYGSGFLFLNEHSSGSTTEEILGHRDISQ